MNIFGSLFDWNGDGQLDAIEQAQECMLLNELLQEEKKKDPKKKPEEKKKP